MCSAGVVGTVPRIAPVAGSRAMSCSSSAEVSFVVLIGERLSLLQAAFGANPLQAQGELGLRLIGLVVARAAPRTASDPRIAWLTSPRNRPCHPPSPPGSPAGARCSR